MYAPEIPNFGLRTLGAVGTLGVVSDGTAREMNQAIAEFCAIPVADRTGAKFGPVVTSITRKYGIDVGAFGAEIAKPNRCAQATAALQEPLLTPAQKLDAALYTFCLSPAGKSCASIDFRPASEMNFDHQRKHAVTLGKCAAGITIGATAAGVTDAMFRARAKARCSTAAPPTCPTGSQWNEATKACKSTAAPPSPPPPPQRIECAEGYIEDATGRCVRKPAPPPPGTSDCPGVMVRDPATGQCNCPPGTTQGEGGGCVQIPPGLQCPSGSYIDATGQCVPWEMPKADIPWGTMAAVVIGGFALYKLAGRKRAA